MNNTTTDMGSETANSQLWQGVTLIVTDLLILFLNFFAMFIIYRFKQKLIPDVLIFSLACADLAKGIFPIPMTIGVYMGWWKLAEGTLGCKLFAWTGFTTNSGAMLVLTLMSCDRYIAICWPFEYKSRISVQKVSYAVAGIYIFAGIHSLLPVVGIGGVSSFQKETFCHFDFDATDQASKAYSVYILVLGFSMLILVIFCYSRSMCKVRGLIQRSQRRMSAMAKRKSQSKQDAAINRMNYMFARMMLVLMISFLISWLLFMIVVLSHVTKWFSVSDGAHFWAMRLAVFNSVLNPLIGAAMCKPYRRGYAYLLQKICCCCCSVQTPPSPWSRRNHGSASIPSRDRSDSSSKAPEESPLAEDKCNLTFENIAHDSGIVPDGGEPVEKTAGCKNSWRQNQGLDLSDISIDQHKTTKPGMQTKRISFKDEMDCCKRPFTETAIKDNKKQRINVERKYVGVESHNLGLDENHRGTSEENVLIADNIGGNLEPGEDNEVAEKSQDHLSSSSISEAVTPDSTLFLGSTVTSLNTTCSVTGQKVPHRTFSLPVVQVTHFPVDCNNAIEVVNVTSNRRKTFHSLNDLPQTNYDQSLCSPSSRLHLFEQERKNLDIRNKIPARNSAESSLAMPSWVVENATNKPQISGLARTNFQHKRVMSLSEPGVAKDDSDNTKFPRSTSPPLRRQSFEEISQGMPTGIATRLKAPLQNEQRREVIC